MQDALGIAEQQGIDSQADYPQGTADWQTQPTAAQHANAAAHRTVGGAFLYQSWSQPPGDSARGAIEAAVASGHPVALSIPVFDAFEHLSPASYSLAAADVASAATLGYHEVLVVGYDATGVRIQNSWGTSWGDRGFADLAWDFIAEHSLDASAMTGFAGETTAAPAVASATPAAGPAGGGTQVTIRGLGLAAATAVTFGDAPAGSYTIVDDTTIIASAPPATTVGPVQVRVSGPAGANTSAVTFSYLPSLTAETDHRMPGPTIRRISRISAHVVVIRGSALLAATTVRFGARRARIIATSNHVIRVRIPLRVSLFTGVVAVRVTTPFGTSPVTRARFRSST